MFDLCDRLLSVVAERGLELGVWQRLGRAEAIEELRGLAGVEVSDDVADWWAYWRDCPPLVVNCGLMEVASTPVVPDQYGPLWEEVYDGEFFDMTGHRGKYDEDESEYARTKLERRWPDRVWPLTFGDLWDTVASPIEAGTVPRVYGTHVQDTGLSRLDWGPGFSWIPLTLQQWIEARIAHFETGYAQVVTETLADGTEWIEVQDVGRDESIIHNMGDP